MEQAGAAWIVLERCGVFLDDEQRPAARAKSTGGAIARKLLETENMPIVFGHTPGIPGPKPDPRDTDGGRRGKWQASHGRLRFCPDGGCGYRRSRARKQGSPVKAQDDPPGYRIELESRA